MGFLRHVRGRRARFDRGSYAVLTAARSVVRTALANIVYLSTQNQRLKINGIMFLCLDGRLQPTAKGREDLCQTLCQYRTTTTCKRETSDQSQKKSKQFIRITKSKEEEEKDGRARKEANEASQVNESERRVPWTTLHTFSQ